MPYPKIALDGAVVAVTGGARGIGKATDALFASKGAAVCVGTGDGAAGRVVSATCSCRASRRC